MTESNDELVQQLAAADPVDPSTLPSPTDPKAQRLLEGTMTDDPTPTTSPTSSSTPTATPLELPAVRGVDRYAGAGRSRGRILGAAAAAVIVILGFVLFAPDNATPALATIHNAAETTAGFDSGRVTTTFTVDADDGTEAASAKGQIDAAFSGQDVAVTLDLTELEGEGTPFVPEAIEGRLVDDVLYGNDAGTWYALETGGFLGQAAMEFVDPRTVLTAVQDLLDTEEVGQAAVDGIETTQYRSIVDLGDESLQDSGWLPMDVTELQVEGEMTVDLFVDADGLLRQLVVDAAVQEPEGDGVANLSLVTSFFDLGADIAIEAPADAITIEPGSDVDLDELLND